MRPTPMLCLALAAMPLAAAEAGAATIRPRGAVAGPSQGELPCAHFTKP